MGVPLLEKICESVNNTNVEGIPASDIVAQVVDATRLPIRHFDMPTVYIAGSQQFSPTSLKRVISAFDPILNGEAERLYREKPTSKWTVQTLDAYRQLDKQLLAETKVRLQRLLDQEVYYCKIREIAEIEYDGWVYDFKVEDHHNFVADNILCHNTIQLITLLLHDREAGAKQSEPAPGPTLLICPMSIVGNWHRELQRFAPSLRVMIHHGHERLSGQAFEDEARQHDIVITTYALALRDKALIFTQFAEMGTLLRAHLQETLGCESLFPTAARELDTDCSCPDWANPCKHIAAVYYLLAERFDEDPFLIFKLRGRTKEQIIETLRHKRVETLPAESTAPSVDEGESTAAENSLSLEEHLDKFWQAGEALATFTVNPTAPKIDKAILKRLGDAPFVVV